MKNNVEKIYIESVSLENEKATATVIVDGTRIEYVKIGKIYGSFYFRYLDLSIETRKNAWIRRASN